VTNQFKRQHFISWCEDNKEDVEQIIKYLYENDIADKMFNSKNGYGLLYDQLKDEIHFKLFPNELLNHNMRFQFNEGSSILFHPKMLFSQKANRLI
tara:strand:- start:481 stop:768 length:288 start_codon:yes stop_codon:yes gene_type:complete